MDKAEQDRLAKEYTLSPEENERIFREKVVPYFLATFKPQPSDNPTFALISGAPGAGKSTVSRKFGEKMGTAIVFGADDLRKMHPKADEVMEKYHDDYPFVNSKDSSIWRTKLINYCFENNYNVILESVLKNKGDDKLPVFTEAKEAGYKVEVAFLGVDKALSNHGMNERYERQEEQRQGYGFPPTYETHDVVYEIMPKIATDMIDNPSIDRVSIYDRNGGKHFDSSFLKAKSYPCGAERQSEINAEISKGFEESRNQSLRDASLSYISSSWEKITESQEERLKAGRTTPEFVAETKRRAEESIKRIADVQSKDNQESKTQDTAKANVKKLVRIPQGRGGR